ncbi:Amino acid transporter, transmembrane domain containing protein [Trema orientale]|uniref:Amino acid transporter, transmembrane domain containing protein n=1 Tax=Trema orientale TaxID=63057 RepID=A0A2P5C027_TREOI|nr:Amino acid transporter, transmembrane domain containing protein [Trema orientale]
MKLYDFTIVFGVLMLFLAQIPSFHSLRHINLVSLVLCLAFSICAVIGSLYIGNLDQNGLASNYPVKEQSDENRVLAAFNVISIIATAYGSGVFPDIQATIAPPVKGKKFKGLCISYSVIVSTSFSAAISGYWAFGNQTKGTILENFIGENHKPLLPIWFLVMTILFILLQTYLQPTNEVLEKTFADPKKDRFSARNVVPRLIFRSMSVIVATTLATMLPFFGDLIRCAWKHSG